MTAKELLKAMGFEHEQESYHSQIDGVDVLITTHMIFHDGIPGLFVAGNTLEKAVKNIVPAMKILILMNLGKKTAEEMREMGLLK